MLLIESFLIEFTFRFSFRRPYMFLFLMDFFLVLKLAKGMDLFRTDFFLKYVWKVRNPQKKIDKINFVKLTIFSTLVNFAKIIVIA